MRAASNRLAAAFRRSAGSRRFRSAQRARRCSPSSSSRASELRRRRRRRPSPLSSPRFAIQMPSFPRNFYRKYRHDMELPLINDDFLLKMPHILLKASSAAAGCPRSHQAAGCLLQEHISTESYSNRPYQVAVDSSGLTRAGAGMRGAPAPQQQQLSAAPSIPPPQPIQQQQQQQQQQQKVASDDSDDDFAPVAPHPTGAIFD